MKELYVVFDSYQPSSAGTNHLLAYVKGFVESGVKVTLFFLCPSSQNEKMAGYMENVEVRYLWDNSFCKKNRYIQAVISSLKLLSYYKKDIPIYISGTSMMLPILTYRKGFNIYHERTENPEASGRIHSFIGDFLFKRYIKSLLKLNGLFVITPSLRDFFIDEYGLNRSKVHVANMVVDSDRFDKTVIDDPECAIGYCGTISQRKDGILYLLKAFSIVQQSHPEYRLKIAGGFESQKMKKDVMDTIEKDHISNIDFLGRISMVDMPKFLSSCKILALSRPRQKEKAFGFATKIGEYLMTTRPVVMTNVGDASFYLKDRESTIFAQPNDECDFANQLLWAIDHYEEAKIIGKNGRDVACNSFNYKTESKKIIDVIY